ncbi:heavy metal translocating P-type ATPase [Bosea sp. 117]|uniref:heavy metal translocating P-type ATPase n=1 Tax=Bosea sp. 117 TaxID=1125973 RepID=UPI000493CB06|nr:heavy metal translocating P-type ATPase [Bosea sp. 117]
MISLPRRWVTTIRSLLVLIPALGLAAGFLLVASGRGGGAGTVWALATVPVVATLLVQIVVSLRRGDTGLDIVAALSMGGALLLGEPLAAVVVALMYAGGQYLETFAERRATREMAALVARAPRSALRYAQDGLSEVPIEAVKPGDRLLVRKGEVVPVDGRVADGIALIDLSALTGESLPVTLAPHAEIPSGALNAGAPFDLLADRPASESTYAGIVRLVEAAREAKAPIGRLADRYALVFLAVVLVIAGGAYAASGDPVRALAVLVTATPCPLILAVPVALIAGVSRAARRGVLVKGAGVLEALAGIRCAVVDKTGTLTQGQASLVAIEPMGDLPEAELLRLAASLDQASQHVVAASLVHAAQARGLTLSMPRNVEETPGEGVEGDVAGRRVRVGGIDYVRSALRGGVLHDVPRSPGTLRVAIAVDGLPAGLLLLADELRAEAAGALASWRRSGVERIVLASGDRRDVAEHIGAALGVDEVRAGLRPEDKVAIVEEERRRGPVMMLGDGVNDAPALAAATLGVAMGARGAAASSEAADAVLMTDRLDRLGEAMAIARRSLGIARQSVIVGIGLSFLAMAIAAAGWLSPVQGALVQEAIDVAVILNALRALGGPPPGA